MSFTLAKIKAIREIAENLEKCGETPFDEKFYSKLNYYVSVGDPAIQFEATLRKLLWDKPHIADRIEREYYDLIRDAPKVSQITGKAERLTEIGRLQSRAKNLAEEFRDIEQMARKERRHRWLKRICVFITVLAALLTCIYLSWLLWTTFWKK